MSKLQQRSFTRSKTLFSKLFLDELQSGKITAVQTRACRVHAISAVPKKGTLELLPITDCSKPFSNNLNSHITNDPSTLQSVDYALKFSTPGCFYAVVDIKTAYGHVPLCRKHRKLRGFWCSFGEELEAYYTNNLLFFLVGPALQPYFTAYQSPSPECCEIVVKKLCVI